MRLLLDMHALQWWWADDPQLTAAARAALQDSTNEVFVSAASASEIAARQRISKLPPWPMPAGGMDAMVAAEGFARLAVSSAHAWHAGRLDWAHRDPFDRMLAAQATLEGLTHVTRDPVSAPLTVQVLW